MPKHIKHDKMYENMPQVVGTDVKWRIKRDYIKAGFTVYIHIYILQKI